MSHAIMWKHILFPVVRRYANGNSGNHVLFHRVAMPRRRPLPVSFFSTSKNEEPEKFAMPDRDMELKLAAIQSRISEHYKQGDFSKALKVSKQLFQQSQAHFGQNHPATASALNNMGLMQKLLGDFIESRKHYTAALRIYAKVVGRDHASYAMTLHNLASLNKAQVHFDTTLKATERLTLVETALEYFEEAFLIRKAELGDEHPLTIATQSSWGSTLAAQVLHQHRHVGSDTSNSHSNSSSTATTNNNSNSNNNNKAKYVSLNPEAVTRQGWEAAEHHLRQALETAIQNPRGKKTKQSKKVASPSSAKKTLERAMETLSAAAAAQNLAIFLKSRAMTEDPYNMDRMNEAKALYDQVLLVREQLLPNAQHPDLLATKYSMAELLAAMGDEPAANTIRQEILDGYEPSKMDPEERDDIMDEAPAPKVVVEKTTSKSDQTKEIRN